MSQGSVTVAADGTVTSSGLAGAIFDARVAMLADVPAPAIPNGPAGYAMKHGLALDANALATAIYPEILAALPTPLLSPGHVAAFAGATIPTGWLACNGASVLRASYAALFTAIGTTFGAVDATHFTLPTIPDIAVGVAYVIKT
jgi:hypothetical protein